MKIKEKPEKLYTLEYEKPNHTIWNDKTLNGVIELIKKGYSLKQIGKLLDVSKGAIDTALYNYRKKPKWFGKIPYLKQTPRTIVQERDHIGILDIEFFAFNFKANRGIILTYCIKEYRKDKWYRQKIDFKDMRKKNVQDRNIVRSLVNDICKFDVIIGYYSNRCDLPFVRTRAMFFDIVFPYYNSIKQIDLWEFFKYKMSLDRNTLRNATKITHIVGKDNADIDLWMEAALCGDKHALNEIYKHNIRDVKITEKLYDKVKPYLSGTIKPI